MTSLDTLPPDQRAVLQLVLQRGRSYDDIAQLLSIDRAAVRDRALRALDALGPHTRVADERRALITDYLLGQLPAGLSADTRNRLAESASERAWARVIASELAPLSSRPLPEIPVNGGPATPEPAAAEPEPAPARRPVAAEPVAAAASQPAQATKASKIPSDYGLAEPRAERERPSSRLGGAVLLGLGAFVAVIVVVLIVVLAGGSSSNKHSSSIAQNTTPSTPAASTSTTGSTTPQVTAQINLTSPNGSSRTAGIAEVLKQGAARGIAIVAQDVPPNSKHDAYAVWLYNSAADAHILGFVNPGVGSNGRLSTAGPLPTNASHYKELLVTLETESNPKSPGTIVLQGALTGTS